MGDSLIMLGKRLREGNTHSRDTDVGHI